MMMVEIKEPNLLNHIKRLKVDLLIYSGLQILWYIGSNLRVTLEVNMKVI